MAFKTFTTKDSSISQAIETSESVFANIRLKKIEGLQEKIKKSNQDKDQINRDINDLKELYEEIVQQEKSAKEKKDKDEAARENKQSDFDEIESEISDNKKTYGTTRIRLDTLAKEESTAEAEYKRLIEPYLSNLVSRNDIDTMIQKGKKEIRKRSKGGHRRRKRKATGASTNSVSAVTDTTATATLPRRVPTGRPRRRPRGTSGRKPTGTLGRMPTGTPRRRPTGTFPRRRPKDLPRRKPRDLPRDKRLPENNDVVIRFKPNELKKFKAGYDKKTDVDKQIIEYNRVLTGLNETLLTLESNRKKEEISLQDLGDEFSASKKAWNKAFDALERHNTKNKGFIDREIELVGQIGQFEVNLAGFMREIEQFDNADATACPTALLPVRLETKYDEENTMWKIRIFPDQIHVDTHESELTMSEIGVMYEYNQTGHDEGKLMIWRDMVDQFGERRARWLLQFKDKPIDSMLKRATWIVEEIELLKIYLEASTAENKEKVWREMVDQFGEDRVSILFKSKDMKATLRCLPDRWKVVAYNKKGEEIVSLESKPISKDGLSALPASKNDDWLSNYDTALRLGMAVDLVFKDGCPDLDLLIVVGVQDSDDASKELGDLMIAHQYTHGLSIPEVGKATNVLDGVDAPEVVFDAKESHKDAVNAIVKSGTDGDVLATALGLDRALFSQLEGVDKNQFEGGINGSVAHMNRLLWPVTWKYFLRNMIGVDVDNQEHVDCMEEHFIDCVRPGGPLPSLIVNKQPYGVLPISKLDDQREGFDGLVAGLLKVLRKKWAASLDQVNTTAKNAAADDVFLDISQTEPFSQGFSLRELQAVETLLCAGLNLPKTELVKSIQENVKQSMLDFAAPITGAIFGNVSSPLYTDLVCKKAELSETEPLKKNYIKKIEDLSVTELKHMKGAPLLAQLLIASKMTLFLETANKRKEKTDLLVDLFDRNMDSIGRDKDIKYWLKDISLRHEIESSSELKLFNTALSELAELPTAKIDRIFKQVLDTCSHRLDAWITATATKRMNEIRKKNRNKVRVGAYGWLENLSTGEKNKVKVPSGGWVHAPSVDQAAAGGLLRSAQLAKGGEGGDLLKVDLSSKRVRSAMRLLEGVRQGIGLSTLLGYRLERNLRNKGLNRFILILRNQAPLVVDKEVDKEVKKELSSEVSSEMLGASNLIDGLAIIKLNNDKKLSFSSSDDDAKKIGRLINELEDDFDALGDLLMAEGVYQHVKGNSVRAGAAFSAATNGEHVPESIEVIKTTRPGIQHSQNLFVIENTGDESRGENPRSKAEPVLSKWCDKMLSCLSSMNITYSTIGGGNIEIKLQDLNLDAIDFVYMATEEASFSEEIKRRVEPLDNEMKSLEITHESEVVGMGALYEVCSTLKDIISSARPLIEDDFPSLGLELNKEELILRMMALQIEFSSTIKKLEDITETTSFKEINDCRIKICRYGEIRGWPDTAVDRDEVVAKSELLKHVKAIAQQGRTIVPDGEFIQNQLDAGQFPSITIEECVNQIKNILGKDFTVLPSFTLKYNSDSEVNTEQGILDWFLNESAVGDAHAVETWLKRSSMVKDGISKFDRGRMYAGMLNYERMTDSFHVMQLPLKAGDTWISKKSKENDLFQNEDAGSKTSIVIHSTSDLDLSKSIAGMKIDGWEEVIPFKDQHTGLAFNYNAPNSEAPNTILLAMPDKGRNMSVDDLIKMVKETNELAKIRMVDPNSLKGLGHFLPAIYLPQYPKQDSATTVGRAGHRDRTSGVQMFDRKIMNIVGTYWENKL